MATPVDCGGGGGTSHPSANYDGEAVPNPSQSRPISNQLRTLVTVIDADHPEANVDSFAISTSPVLSILSVPAYTPSTSPTLPSTSSTSTATAASQWNAVPLNLSDELIVEGYDTQFLTASFMMSTSLMSMSSQQQPNQSVTAGSVEDVHSTTNPSVDTKKPTTTSTLSPTNPISGSRSRLTDIPSSPCPSEDPNSGGANTGLAYFVERRRFVVQPLNDNASEVRLRHHREQTSSDKASSSADQTNENDSLLQPSVEQPSSSSTVSTQNYQRQDLTGSTVWLGCQNGDLYVHNSSSSSSEQQLSLRKRCLQLVHLPDSILGMCLANGQIVAFRRQILPALKASPSSDVLVDSDCPSPKPDSTYRTSTVVGDACCWDFTEACVVTCSRSRSDLTSPLPVQAIPSAATTTTTSCSQDTVWVGSRGLLLIIDADSLQLLNCLQVDTSLEAQVRQLICSTSPSSSTSIVWASFRRSSLLRSFDTSTYQPLHCIDLKPVISRALAGEFNTSNQVEPITDSGQLSITALQTTTSVSSPQLWIGTNLGLIALLPTLNAEKSNINMKLLRVCRQRFRGPVKQILALSHSQRVLAFGQGVHLENEEAWKLLSSASPRPSNESRDDGGESPNRQLQSTPTDPGCDIIAWQLA